MAVAALRIPLGIVASLGDGGSLDVLLAPVHPILVIGAAHRVGLGQFLDGPGLPTFGEETGTQRGTWAGGIRRPLVSGSHRRAAHGSRSRICGDRISRLFLVEYPTGRLGHGGPLHRRPLYVPLVVSLGDRKTHPRNVHSRTLCRN